jgi:hypothetical protein
VGEGMGFNNIGAAFICQEFAERLAWPRSWIGVPCVPYSSNCGLLHPVSGPVSCSTQMKRWCGVQAVEDRRG